MRIEVIFLGEFGREENVMNQVHNCVMGQFHRFGGHGDYRVKRNNPARKSVDFE